MFRSAVRRSPSKATGRRTHRARSTRGVGRPIGAVSEATRLRIIAAACQCFADRGYAMTSNQAIAQAAGLTTGALYHYFASKADLFAAVHRHVQGVVLGLYQKGFAEQPTCVAQLCAGLQASLAVTRSHPKLAQFASIAELEIQRHPELSAVLEPDSLGVRKFFAQLLAAGHKRGEITRGVDTETVVNLVVSSLFGLAWLHTQVERQGEYEATIGAFQRLLHGTLFRA